MPNYCKYMKIRIYYIHGGGNMMRDCQIERMYDELNIHNEGIEVRKTINKGSLNKKLHADCSALLKERKSSMYSAGIQTKLSF